MVWYDGAVMRASVPVAVALFFSSASASAQPPPDMGADPPPPPNSKATQPKPPADMGEITSPGWAFLAVTIPPNGARITVSSSCFAGMVSVPLAVT